MTHVLSVVSHNSVWSSWDLRWIIRAGVRRLNGAWVCLNRWRPRAGEERGAPRAPQQPRRAAPVPPALVHRPRVWLQVRSTVHITTFTPQILQLLLDLSMFRWTESETNFSKKAELACWKPLQVQSYRRISYSLILWWPNKKKEHYKCAWVYK